MALYSGIDPVAVATCGVFTETYGSTSPANIANLFVSYGLLEDAPEPTEPEPTLINHILEIGKAGLRIAAGILRIG